MPLSKKFYNIQFTMMEPETLHPNFAHLCNSYADEIITPTKWNKEVFIKGGINKPIHVCPLGVNTDIFNSSVRKSPMVCREFPSGNATTSFPSFNFITVFGWSYRKGIDVLLRSYFEAFNGNDDVGLIICSRYSGGSDRRSKSVVERDIKKFMGKFKNPPRVYYYGEEMDIDVLPSIIKNGDCFVWTSRGEGFGLPVVEAGALGIPVLSTFNSGMTEFLNDRNSYSVKTDSLIPAIPEIKKISPYYHGQMFPKLGDSVVEEFSDKMKHIYCNYDEAIGKSVAFSEDVKEKYTWDICAKRIYEILGEIKRDG